VRPYPRARRFTGRGFVPEAFVRRGGVSSSAPGEVAVAPRDPVYDHQFVAMLGAPAGLAAYLELLYHANTLASPIEPTIGALPLATAAGTPVYGVNGPSAAIGDTFSKAVRLTDGQDVSIDTATSPLVIGARSHALFQVKKIAAGTIGGNRSIWGWNGTEDGLIQLRSNGSLWYVIVDGGVTTTVQLNVDHHDDVWCASMAVSHGGSARMASNRGTGAAVSISPDINTISTLRVGQGNNCAAMDWHTGAVLVGDGTSESNTLFQDLYDNAQAYCANYLAALVTP
jgi:hypothetical protein